MLTVKYQVRTNAHTFVRPASTFSTDGLLKNLGKMVIEGQSPRFIEWAKIIISELEVSDLPILHDIVFNETNSLNFNDYRFGKRVQWVRGSDSFLNYVEVYDDDVMSYDLSEISITLEMLADTVPCLDCGF